MSAEIVIRRFGMLFETGSAHRYQFVRDVNYVGLGETQELREFEVGVRVARCSSVQLDGTDIEIESGFTIVIAFDGDDYESAAKHVLVLNKQMNVGTVIDALTPVLKHFSLNRVFD